MRVSFNHVFKTNPDGSYEPKKTVSVGGITMGPGVLFTSGVSFGGFNISEHAGKDLDIDETSTLITIKGVY